MYSVVKTAVGSAGTGVKDLGAVVKVTVPDIALAQGSRITISMPTGWDFGVRQAVVGTAPVTFTPGVPPAPDTPGQITLVGAAGFTTTDDSQVSVKALGGAGKTFTINSNNTFDFVMAAPDWTDTNANGVLDAGDTVESGANKYFYIYFNGIDLNNATGDLAVTFIAPAGSVFSTGQVNIGTASRDGATSSSCKKVNELSQNGRLDSISISELQADTITAGKITLKILTKGVTWDSTNAVLGAAAFGWDFSGRVAGDMDSLAAPTVGTVAFTNSDKNFEYTLPATAAIFNATEPGRISFASLPIIIDDDDLKAGDEIQIRISGAGVTEQTLTVAKYATYGLSIESGTAKDVVAGQLDQEVGTFKIKEAAAGSLIPNRTIKVALPSGAVWNTLGDLDVLNNSDITNLTQSLNSDRDVLTLTLPTGGDSTNAGAEIEFNDYSVDLAPDFAGALEVKISGSAGLSETIKIADVKPALTISCEDIKNINLGQANQAIGDITLTEGAAEGLQDNDLVLVLDEGYRWANTPTVKVTEGNLDIDEVGVKITSNSRRLLIPIDSQSTTAAKIVISGATIDAMRTAPEGAVKLSIGSWTEGNRAVQEAANPDWNDKCPGKAQIATCVTPAESTGRNACFYIGSTIMNVNGANIIMDAAPYIKAGRTYVPVRYLGDALGATTAWDEATKTVTVTKGDKTVVLVIGSTVAKVNGADVQMDVAPEITGVGRTMLPARWVAEGLGYQVGWNAALQQVVIQ